MCAVGGAARAVLHAVRAVRVHHNGRPPHSQGRARRGNAPLPHRAHVSTAARAQRQFAVVRASISLALARRARGSSSHCVTVVPRQVVRLGLAVDPVVVIAGLSNDYADYTTTYDEYQEQRYPCCRARRHLPTHPRARMYGTCRIGVLTYEPVHCIALHCLACRYEGGSTTYGPWEHEAFTHELLRLVRDMASGAPSATLPPPSTDLSKMIELQVARSSTNGRRSSL